MPSEPDNTSENPYESPQIEADSPPLEQHLAWTLIIRGILILLGVLSTMHWTREFGIPGLIMLLGGYGGSHLGWWLSRKRWWGFAAGGIAGFTGGAVLGIILLFSHLVFSGSTF